MIEKKIQDAIIELSENSKKSSASIIKESLRLLFPKTMGKWRFIGIILFTSLITMLITYNINSFVIVEKISELIIEVFLATFAIVFTGYSIFQALLTPKIIFAMLEMPDNEEKEKSSFTGSNEYYMYYSMLNIMTIAVSFFIRVICDVLPQNWNLTNNIKVNNLLFGVLCWLYIYLAICTWVELVSFITNIYHLYNVAATERYIEEIKNRTQNEGGGRSK